MEKDFEKDLLSSLATHDKVNLSDFAEYFDDTLDVSKHSGLLVQVKAPKEIMRMLLGTDPLMIISSEYIQKRLDNSNGILTDWIQGFLKPIVKKETPTLTGIFNDKRIRCYMVMLLNELFDRSFVSNMCEVMHKDLVKEGMDEEEIDLLLRGIRMSLTMSLSKACMPVNIKILDNNSIVYTIEFDTEKFNNDSEITKVFSNQDILPFQLVLCNYITKEQEEIIKNIPVNKIGVFDAYSKSDEPCNCPNCQRDRAMQNELRGMGIDFSPNED